MRRLALTLAAAALVAPASAVAQGYQIPAGNPYIGQTGRAPEVYAVGLRNPFRFSFDRQTGDLLIGDVGGGEREEVNWISTAAARGANFGWACREGSVAGPKTCSAPAGVEPLFDYPTPSPGSVIGGFVVRDPSLTGLVGRYLYADHYAGEIRSVALDRSNPDDSSTDLNIDRIGGFGEDAAARLYLADLNGGQVRRLKAGATPGTLGSDALSGSFAGPVAVAGHPSDPSRLFVAEIGGKVRLVVADTALATPFIDVASFGISAGGERGLLSVTAAPDYENSGRIFVYYTASDGDIRIDEFRRSAGNPNTADPASRRNLMTIEHSSEGNHNGGTLQFGPDGCLWATTGDGGGQNDQHDNAQNLSTLLGKVLRIDPDPPGQSTTCEPAPGQPSGGGSDATAPRLLTRTPRRQRVLRQRGLIAYTRCSNESCNLSMTARLRIGRLSYPLQRVRRALGANRRVKVRAKLTARARRALRRALRSRKPARVDVAFRARDAAGNRSPLKRTKVRVRR